MLQCRAPSRIECTCTTVIVLVGNTMTMHGFEDFGRLMTPVFSFESNFPFLFPQIL